MAQARSETLDDRDDLFVQAVLRWMALRQQLLQVLDAERSSGGRKGSQNILLNGVLTGVDPLVLIIPGTFAADLSRVLGER